jgi:exopolyphosphatase / guanosine-5'-triphosphate,3'-diphosphate pyrophosphatase
MGLTRRAVIDVGTNSIKLLVGDIERGTVLPVFETSRQTRLGRGLYEHQQLQPEAIRETAEAVAEFAAEAARLGASETQVIATSAMREARNAGELQQVVLAGAGLPVRIITGEEEAELAYRGAATDAGLRNERLLLLDMGGGSTEMIIGCGGQTEFRASFPIGTLRIMAHLHLPDNPTSGDLAQCRQWLRDFLENEIKPLLEPVLKQGANPVESNPTLLVGTGGTATILGRMEAERNDYDRDAIESVRITRERMRWHTDRLWSLPLAERRTVTGLPPSRADVILAGAATYEAIMEKFGFDVLRVSTRGLRFAALLK